MNCMHKECECCDKVYSRWSVTIVQKDISAKSRRKVHKSLSVRERVFDHQPGQNAIVARGVKMSSRGTRVGQVELEKLLTYLPNKRWCFIFKRNYNLLIIVRSARLVREAGTSTWRGSTLVKDFTCQKLLKELSDNRLTEDSPFW